MVIKAKTKKRKKNPTDEWLQEQINILESIGHLLQSKEYKADQRNKISSLLRETYYTIEDMTPRVFVDTFDYDEYNRQTEEKRREELKQRLKERQKKSGMIR